MKIFFGQKRSATYIRPVYYITETDYQTQLKTSQDCD